MASTAKPANKEAEDDDAGGAATLFSGSKIYVEGDDFLRKWGGPMFIAPLVPAIFAIFIIITGQLILNTWTGSCGYPLNSFISAAIVLCYMLLLVFSWTYLGDTIKINFWGKERTVLVPYTELRFIMGVYGGLSFLSFIIWIVGSALLPLAFYCIQTAPELYSYSLFLVASYWIGFIVIVTYSVRLAFGSAISNAVAAQLKGPSLSELEERIFKKKFNEMDKDKTGQIGVDDVSTLLQNLGVYVPEEEVPGLVRTLDPSSSGFIKFEPMAAWFKKLNANNEDDDDKNAEKK